jgi:bacterial microcompartments protein
MDIRIIKSPSKATLDIILRRKGSSAAIMTEKIGAIGLLQGKVIDMLVASDIAEKAAGVTVEDIKGNCPQNMLVLAILGDTSSVEAAIMQIKKELNEGKYICD